MRKHYMMMFFAVLFAITSTVAQNFSLLSATENEVKYSHDLDPFVQNFIQINLIVKKCKIKDLLSSLLQ